MREGHASRNSAAHLDPAQKGTALNFKKGAAGSAGSEKGQSQRMTEAAKGAASCMRVRRIATQSAKRSLQPALRDPYRALHFRRLPLKVPRDILKRIAGTGAE
jgi:hypothetical protein